METYYTVKRICWNCAKLIDVEIPKGQVADNWQYTCPICGVAPRQRIIICEPSTERRRWPWGWVK